MVPDITAVRAQKRQNRGLQSGFCLLGTSQEEFSTAFRVINEVVLGNVVDIQALRGIRGFLSLEAGVVRGMLPAIGRRYEQEQSKDLEIARLRRKLGERSEELAELKAVSSAGNLRNGVPIFFVVGLPKSGTTSFMGMLNQPEVLCQGEG
jgi:hypothetical protein